MSPRHLNQYGKPSHKPLALYDKILVLAIFSLIIIGLLAVASSSVMLSTKYYHNPFYFLTRQIIHVCIGIFFALIILRTDSAIWERLSIPLLLICLFLLILVLIPNFGRVVNGSRRWLSLGIIGIQVSEICKAAIIFYIAGYLVRQNQNKTEGNIIDVLNFLKPILVLVIFSSLLLLEPDFGATVVISMTVLAMLFLTDVPLRYFFVLVLMLAAGLIILIIVSPYRMIRLTAFLNPWADQYNTGYQLTQSLIAFGRGGWFGVGFGEGIQKLLYLPEAHTDFLFAVLAEEVGFVGILLVLLLYSILICRGFLIGLCAFKQNRIFNAYTAYGITSWFGIQALINIGVNVGLLPTKGLTLPFMSYGGASIVVCVAMAAILIRIDYENRWQALGL